jgi:two-component system OmpR family response regulator
MLLLLLEDDQALREGLADVLRQDGYEVETSADGRRALALLNERAFDLAIVDLGVPVIDGLEVVRLLRQRQNGLPVLIITARDSLSDRIAGLDSGADDYLIKPFETPELEARIRALLRRHRAGREAEIHIGPLAFTPGHPQIKVGDSLMELPAGELVLLELLANHPGRSVSKEKIAARFARGGEPPSNTAIEVSMHRLRRKLIPFGLRIRALRGFGYVLEVPVED